MKDSRKYINSKTNSILKNNIKRNNRDTVATVVFNELLDLYRYATEVDDVTEAELQTLRGYISFIYRQLYTDTPMRLIFEGLCLCRTYSNCGDWDDYFVRALLLYNKDPWLWEDDRIIFLERQKYKNLINESEI